jgi:hypothetical protein
MTFIEFVTARDNRKHGVLGPIGPPHVDIIEVPAARPRPAGTRPAPARRVAPQSGRVGYADGSPPHLPRVPRAGPPRRRDPDVRGVCRRGALDGLAGAPGH